MCPDYQLLEDEVASLIHFQLDVVYCIVLQMKSASAINPFTTEIPIINVSQHTKPHIDMLPTNRGIAIPWEQAITGARAVSLVKQMIM